MNKLFIMILSVAMSLSIIGCPKKSNRRVSVGQNGQRGARVNNQNNSNGVSGNFNCPSAAGYGDYPGVIYNINGNDSQYQQSVEGLLSGMSDLYGTGGSPENQLQFGSISGNCDADTGIVFNGKVENFTYQQNGNNNATISDYTSQLNLVIFDSFAKQNPSIGGVGVYAIDGADGEITNNQININFYWSKEIDTNQGLEEYFGIITLNGSVQNGNFTGSMSYKNNEDASQYGSGGQSGTLGGFVIPVCSFFRCQ